MTRRATRLRVEPLEDRATPSAGAPDPTFSGDGIQQFGTQPVTEVAVAPDGHIFAVTAPLSTAVPSALLRFNSDGTPDTTFGSGGSVALSGSTGTGIVLTPTPDGGVYLGSGGSSQYTVTRYTSAGVLDPTFGTGGNVTAPLPNGNTSQEGKLDSLTVLPDGRVLLVGDRTFDRLILGQPAMYYQLALAELTPAGQFDPSFGTNGVAIVTDPSGTITSLFGGGAAVQPDGRIVIAGSASTTPLGQRGQVYNAAALRLTPTGQLDTTFGTGGFTVVTTPDIASGLFRTASILSDGRVMAAGGMTVSAGQRGAAVRLTADGKLDASYGTGGIAVAPAANSASGGFAAIDTTGRAVFGSATYDYNQGGFLGDTVIRLTADGATDTSFGTNGQVVTNTLPGLSDFGPNGSHLVPTPALQADGNILLGGSVTTTTTTTGLLVRLVGTNPPTGFVPTATGAFTAGGAADGSFQVLNPTNGTYSAAAATTVYAGAAVGVRTATADVNGDGTPDYITGAGPGGGPEVTVYDGKTGARVSSFLAFEPTFTGGVFVAAADLTGDGRAEVVVTPDQGGSGRVVVFQIFPGGAAVLRTSFLGIDDPNFRGGARIALGDVNKDGTPDLVVAAGFLGGPRTAIFDGSLAMRGFQARIVQDFFAFPGTDAVNLRNGVFVAASDVDGDGYADLIFGGGPGGAPRVFTLSGSTLTKSGPDAAQANPISNFFVGGDANDRGGVTVAATGGSVAVGSGQGDAGRVRVYASGSFFISAEPSGYQDVSVFGGATVTGGVFVG